MGIFRFLGDGGCCCSRMMREAMEVDGWFGEAKPCTAQSTKSLGCSW